VKIMREFVALALAAVIGLPVTAQPILEDKYLDSDGIPIRYVEAGVGESVLLVHGFSVDLDSMWRDTGVIAALAQDFHVIAMDARGHGQSGKPHDSASYGLEMVEDVKRLLDHLKVTQAHIVGYSMGGAIVGKFAMLYPERVQTLIFGGSSPRLWNDVLESRSIELADSLERGHGLRPLILALAPPGKPPSDEEIAERNRRQLARNDPHALAAIQRSNRQQAVRPEEISGLKMPVLAIVGSEDPAKAGVDNMIRLRPQTAVVVIQGAPHIGAEARPEFLYALQDFLRAN
jgi:pimeloyl-ACP methyl ester carboxylesterase